MLQPAVARTALESRHELNFHCFRTASWKYHYWILILTYGIELRDAKISNTLIALDAKIHLQKLAAISSLIIVF